MIKPRLWPRIEFFSSRGQESWCLFVIPQQLFNITRRNVLRVAEDNIYLPRWLSGKESNCQCRSLWLNPWGGNMPRRRKWQPTPVFLPEKSHGQRSLVGYSPWGRKELDTTERLTLSLSGRTKGSTGQRGVHSVMGPGGGT